MRPPGYEPGELPTAPLRDIGTYAHPFVLRVQNYDFMRYAPSLCRVKCAECPFYCVFCTLERAYGNNVLQTGFAIGTMEKPGALTTADN